MNDKSEVLNKLDNAKLIDVIKNHKQYGYDDDIRDTAIKILSSRGIDEETLRLTGNDKNFTYDTTEDIYKAHHISSTFTILFYCLSIAFKLVATIMLSRDETFSIVFIILFFVTIALYCTFLIRSYLKLNDFYKSINRKVEVGEQIGYFIIGMPLYIFVYFYYRSKMKEDLKMMH